MTIPALDAYLADVAQAMDAAGLPPEAIDAMVSGLRHQILSTWRRSQTPDGETLGMILDHYPPPDAFATGRIEPPYQRRGLWALVLLFAAVLLSSGLGLVGAVLGSAALLKAAALLALALVGGSLVLAQGALVSPYGRQARTLALAFGLVVALVMGLWQAIAL